MSARLNTAARAERDRDVVRRWLHGESQTDIARAFGLTHSGVQRILARKERDWLESRADALRQATQPGTGPTRSGRPSVWPDCPPELLPQYRKIRAVIGSAAAKAQLLALNAQQPLAAKGGV